MLLTCPTCRTGLAVPDGTTALVRCPACKAVFAPADGAATPPEPEEDAPRPARKPARRPRDDDEDDDRPRRGRAAARGRRDDRDEEDEDEEEERAPRRKRRRVLDESLSAEERAAVIRSFDRAAWGARLIWISFVLFILSMLCVDAFWFKTAFPSLGTDPDFVIAAGVIGAVGWLLAAVGVGLCLSGPPSPGHWGYGVAAGSLTVLHLILLSVLAAKGKEYSGGLVADPAGPAAHWGLVPTRLDAVTYYLTVLIYKGESEIVPKADLGLSIVVGVVEILRTTLILVFLSCLAQAAGDKELSYRCTRAAGFTSYGPGFMALGMLVLAVVIIESRAGFTNFTKIVFTTAVMGTYTVLIGCLFPGFMAARDVDDACAMPFQSQIPQA